MKFKLYFLFLFFSASFLSAGELPLTNGKITYRTATENKYYNGEIEFGKYSIPYNTINRIQNGEDLKLTFNVSEAASGIFENADLLFGSTGTVWIRGQEIQKITLDHAIIGKADSKKSAPLHLSAEISRAGVNSIKNGYFLIGDDFELDIENPKLEKLIKSLDGGYYYNKQFEKEFSLDPGFNLKPKLKLNAELNYSPASIRGKGRAEVSIFKDKITVWNENIWVI